MTIRYGLLSTEYPTTSPTSGGLSTYTYRMAHLMSRKGIEVHVFVVNDERTDLIVQDKVFVHHLRRSRSSRITNITSRILTRLRLSQLRHYCLLECDSAQVAKYVSTFSSIRPFNAFQYPDFLGIGLKLHKRGLGILVARCSSAIDLYMKADLKTCSESFAQIKAEQKSIQRADLIISPSRLVADHYKKLLRRDVIYVRPPAYLETETASNAPDWLPPRYLVHFAGWLIERKGTDLVLSSVPKAVEQCKELKVVFIGTMNETIHAFFQRMLSLYPENIIHHPPVSKPELYSIIQRSRAALIPSAVDNTPNTLIEALLLNVPVIVSKGASLDELVKGYSRAMILTSRSPDEMARLMVEAWQADHSKYEHERRWLETSCGQPYLPDNALNSHIASVWGHPVIP